MRSIAFVADLETPLLLVQSTLHCFELEAENVGPLALGNTATEDENSDFFAFLIIWKYNKGDFILKQ